MTPDQEKPKWPFDPMQPGDHEPVRIPDDHPAKEQKPPIPGPETKRSSSNGPIEA